MILRRLVVPVCALSLFVAACADDDVEDETPPIDELDTPQDKTDAGVDDEAPADLGSSQGLCARLTPDDIGDATGHSVERASGDEQGCTWDIQDEAAVIAGPNEDEDALLRLVMIDEQRFQRNRSRGTELDDLTATEVGDAYLVRDDEQFTTTLYVSEGSSYFTLSLVAALDDPNATRDALVALARQIIERS